MFFPKTVRNELMEYMLNEREIFTFFIHLHARRSFRKFLYKIL